ncbi:hypothetical protein JOE40_000825 [Arthrobacter sp. PvP102]|uniref:hypothetical protein n=1 Tax=unclassified Arthrobacter TaxID=235627 RepID=UPI001AEAE07C|nr:MULTISPECIES: hypothetical protein [unclassified Arthrobacter]MBP1235357.1 hypothetical protein [Arthrobacter sp. PvP103]MBP1236316.1 hypothetical protein [Arthrobacter sp. PvP102]
MVTSREETENQIIAAHNAYELTSEDQPQMRARWLEGIASALETHADELVALGHQETRLGEVPAAYDSFPPSQLPEPLRDDNPWGIRRRVDGAWEAATKDRDNA